MNNMTKILELEVTQEDIDKAIKQRGKNIITKSCPVAQAVKRNGIPFKGVSHKGVSVSWKPFISFIGDEDFEKFVLDFDNMRYESLRPTKFVLVEATR